MHCHRSPVVINPVQHVALSIIGCEAVRVCDNRSPPLHTQKPSVDALQSSCMHVLMIMQGAAEGDVSQMILLGQMLISGYGCSANPSEGKTWLAAAAAVNGQTVEALLPPPGQQLGHNKSTGQAAAAAGAATLAVAAMKLN